MIKHNSASSVISPYNPIVALNPQMRKQVNDSFIIPIIELFFSTKGGIDNFNPLDADKLMTEIEFCDLGKEFVRPYLYAELMTRISKNEEGKILFKPRYVLSFDRDLTEDEEDENKYPYQLIFQDSEYKEENIRFGVIRLGTAPILYIIFIELQEVIRFIKRLPYSVPQSQIEKIEISSEERRKELISQLIAKQEMKLRNTPNYRTVFEEEISRLYNLSTQELQGEQGKLRINLSWSTTDDLDLHIENEFGGKIDYQNKILELDGSIGKLDIDANAGTNLVSNPQENIVWDIVPCGKHTISVNLYSDREKRGRIPFIIFIDKGEDSRIYHSYVENTITHKRRNVVSFEFLNGKLGFEELL